MLINIDDSQIENLVKEIMENYPESSLNLYCYAYDYKHGRYSFYDEETDNRYTITIKDVVKKFPEFVEGIVKEKWHFCGLDKENFLDPVSYDAVALDGLIQLVILGDIIYG